MEVTADVKRRLAAGEKLVLIDVRESFEHRAAQIEGAELVPMQTVPEHLTALREHARDKTILSPLSDKDRFRMTLRHSKYLIKRVLPPLLGQTGEIAFSA